MSKRYPPEQRARAVKMVLDHLDDYRSVYLGAMPRRTSCSNPADP
jgi:hypothetical protein